MNALPLFQIFNSEHNEDWNFSVNSNEKSLNIASTVFETYARDSRQQYHFMHKCNSMLKYSLFDSQSDREFSFNYAILLEIASNVKP